MVKAWFSSTRVAGGVVAACIMLGASASSPIAGQELKIDPTAIFAAAQDSAGAVWGIAHSQGGLYRWESSGWKPAVAGIPQFGVPEGVWKGPEGGVVVAWASTMPGYAFTWFRGDQFKQLGESAARPFGLRLFTVKSHEMWMTANSPQIFRLDGRGKMEAVYTFEPGQFFAYRHPPGQPVLYCPFLLTPDGKGRVWIWGNAVARYSNWAPLQGIVIYDGRSFAYHRTLPGLPDGAVTFVAEVDRSHMWVALFQKGIYSVDISTLVAMPIAEPQPRAFDRVTKIFAADGGIGVVAEPLVHAVTEAPGHRFSGVLWWQQQGEWKEALPGIDDLPEIVRGSERPWMSTPEVLWLGSRAAGLWWMAKDATARHLIDWRRGFPLDSVSSLYKLRSGKLLAIDREASRSVEFDPAALLEPRASGQNLQVINPYSMLQTDGQFRVWGILSLKQPALDEWDGGKWTPHPLPGNLAPAWLSGLDVDTEGYVWLFPGCQMGPIAVFDPGNGNWLPFPSYQEALQDWRGGQVRFLHAAEDRMKPHYGPGGQIAYMGACNGINYFDGRTWRLWNRRDVPGDSGYFFDGSAFFDAAGHLAVNIHHETWEMSPAIGWRLIPYVPQQSPLVNWFMPKPPLPPPGGCPAAQSSSLAYDRLGRAWWTWQGAVYVGIPGRCLLAFASDQPQPFIDGRLLRRVLIDNRGNTFFETLAARHRLGEYVFLPGEGKYPRTKIRLKHLSPDSLRADFSGSGGKSLLYSWRLDGGPWSTPQSQNSTVLQALSSGLHTVELEAVDDELRVNPIPASAEANIGPLPEQQTASLIEALTNATTDAEREAAIRALAQQPPASVVPALRAARSTATASGQWWIDAAIQQIAQKQNR